MFPCKHTINYKNGVWQIGSKTMGPNGITFWGMKMPWRYSYSMANQIVRSYLSIEQDVWRAEKYIDTGL